MKIQLISVKLFACCIQWILFHVVDSLPLGAAQREFLKFSRTRQVDRPISVEKFDGSLMPMMRVLDSGESDSATWTRSRSGRTRRRRPLSEDNANSVMDKFSGEQWMLIRDNDWQPGEQLEFTKTEETTRNTNDKDTVSMALFPLLLVLKYRAKTICYNALV